MESLKERMRKQDQEEAFEERWGLAGPNCCCRQKRWAAGILAVPLKVRVAREMEQHFANYPYQSKLQELKSRDLLRLVEEEGVEKARAKLKAKEKTGWGYGIGAEQMLKTYRDALQCQHEDTLSAQAVMAEHGHGVSSGQHV